LCPNGCFWIVLIQFILLRKKMFFWGSHWLKPFFSFWFEFVIYWKAYFFNCSILSFLDPSNDLVFLGNQSFCFLVFQFYLHFFFLQLLFFQENVFLYFKLLHSFLDNDRLSLLVLYFYSFFLVLLQGYLFHFNFFLLQLLQFLLYFPHFFFLFFLLLES